MALDAPGPTTQCTRRTKGTHALLPHTPGAYRATGRHAKVARHVRGESAYGRCDDVVSSFYRRRVMSEAVPLRCIHTVTSGGPLS